MDNSTRPKLTPEHLSNTVTDKEAGQIDFAIDVCAMMSQVLIQATELAAADDYDGYSEKIEAGIKAAGHSDAGGSVIASMFFAKIEHYSLQLFSSMADTPVTDLSDFINNHGNIDGVSLEQLLQEFHDHQQKKKGD